MALVEIYHDRVIGTASTIKEDKIVLTVDEVNSEDLVSILKSQLSFPEQYDLTYFKPFLKPSYYNSHNSDSIWNSYDYQLRAETAFRSKEETVTKVQNILSEDQKKNIFKYLGKNLTSYLRFPRNIFFSSIKDVLKDYLFGYIDIFTKQKDKINNTNKKPTVKTAEIESLTENVERLLHEKAQAFIRQFDELSKKSNHNPTDSNYFLIYSDLIAPHYVGMYFIVINILKHF